MTKVPHSAVAAGGSTSVVDLSPHLPLVDCAGKGVMPKIAHSAVAAGTKRHRAKLDPGNTENGQAIVRKRPKGAAASSILMEKVLNLPEEDSLVMIKKDVVNAPEQGAEEEVAATAAQGMAPEQGAEGEVVAATAAQGTAILAATSEAAAAVVATPAARGSLSVDPYVLCCGICGVRLRTAPLYKCQAKGVMHICCGACFSKLTDGECMACDREGVLYRRSTDLEDIFRLQKLTCPFDGCGGLYLYWEAAKHMRECRGWRSHGASCSSYGGKDVR